VHSSGHKSFELKLCHVFGLCMGCCIWQGSKLGKDLIVANNDGQQGVDR